MKCVERTIFSKTVSYVGMQMRLKLKLGNLKTIEAHALKNFPRECCGLLFGKFSENTIEVEEIAEAENVLGSPVAFEADPEFVFKAIDHAEKSGRELVGLYHSHPNITAYVSARDSELMKLWPRAAWLILSVMKDRILELKAYVLENNKIEELEIETC